MKGKIAGVAVFLLLAFAVGFAAVGAVSQAYGGSTPMGLTAMAVSENDDLSVQSASGDDSGLYQAFTNICPFH